MPVLFTTGAGRNVLTIVVWLIFVTRTAVYVGTE
jgi:hypothetical protein